MANSFNRVILMGNLTRDPELRYIPSGKPVCDIGLAVNERKKSPAGEWVDEVAFIDVTLWERQAENAAEFLKKGSPVLIEGRLKMDTWETDGQKRSKLRVTADKMVMVGSPKGAEGGKSEGGATYRSSGSQSRGSAPDNYYESNGGGDDDVPF